MDYLKIYICFILTIIALLLLGINLKTPPYISTERLRNNPSQARSLLDRVPHVDIGRNGEVDVNDINMATPLQVEVAR